jgi:hypothetical protein
MYKLDRVVVQEVRWDKVVLNRQDLRRQGLDWIHLTQDRSQRRAVVSMVMNLLVP